MKETISQINEWLAAGHQLAFATVVTVSGSAPRPVGAHLVVREDGQFAGSVSGGCVENAVIQEAAQVIADHQPRLAHFGISDELSWEVGLACGGVIDVLVQPVDQAIWQQLSEAAAQQLPSLLVTRFDLEPEPHCEQRILPREELPAGLPFPHAATLTELPAELRHWPAGSTVLLEPLAPPPQLMIFGGVHIAEPLTRLAHVLGFRVIVTDPRRRFANRERFPDADQILVAWPQEACQHIAIDQETAIAILTHDPKIDEPALTAALDTGAFYVGAIGSRKTHRKRYVRLANLGAERLERVYGPIGLDIGGDRPEDIALGILAEIIAVRNGRSGRSLRELARSEAAARA